MTYCRFVQALQLQLFMLVIQLLQVVFVGFCLIKVKKRFRGMGCLFKQLFEVYDHCFRHG